MRRRAFGLMIALFFNFLLMVLVVAFFRLVPTELTSARRDHVRLQSFYLGKAMAQEVRAWLRYSEDGSGNPLQGLSGQPTGDRHWPVRYSLLGAVPGLRGGFNGNSDWSAELYLYPDARTLTGDGPHVFKLKVINKCWGEVITAQEFLLQQDSFAKYGFFVDRVPTNGYYTAKQTDVYEGEFHVNGYMPLKVEQELFNNFSEPVFRGKLTFSRVDTTNPYDGIKYVTSSAKPFDGGGQTIVDADGKDRYSKLFTLGRAAIQVGADVPMPATNTSTEMPLAKAAWFGRVSSEESLATQSIASGVNLRTLSNGTLSGIYVKGDVHTMKLRVVDALDQDVPRDSTGRITSGNPVQEFFQAGQTEPSKVIEMRDASITFTIPADSVVSINGAPPSTSTAPYAVGTNNTIVVRPPGTSQNTSSVTRYEVYSGYPNGVIFVDGNIGSVPALDDEQTGGRVVNRDNFMPNDATGGLSGLNYGIPRTIAVNVVKNKYVRLNGSLTRGDTPPGERPTGRQDGLGLVAYDVLIGSEIPRNGENTPLYLYTLMMAGRRDMSGSTQQGSVIYESWSSMAGWGRLFSVGSWVVGVDRVWGDGGAHGWVPTFRHDPQLAYSPPPYYPTQSEYRLVAFQEVAR